MILGWGTRRSPFFLKPTLGQQSFWFREHRARLAFAPIVMVEMVYLSEKGRIQEQMVSDLLDEIKRPLQSYQLGGWGEKVIEAVRQIPRNLIPEMPDRIIAATAKSLNIPRITCDGQIVNSNTVNVVW